jgi:hypothetical protein
LHYDYFRFFTTVLESEDALSWVWSWRHSGTEAESAPFESFNDCVRDAQKNGLRIGDLASEIALESLLVRGRYLSASADYLST